MFHLKFGFSTAMRILPFCLLLACIAASGSAFAIDDSCFIDLDSACLQELASLTLRREIARNGENAIERSMIEALYQTTYADLTQGLSTAQIQTLDRQIKSEIERLQRRESLKKKRDKKTEEAARTAEYGPNFVLFEKLARRKGILAADFRALFGPQALHSFRYRPFAFPPGGGKVKQGPTITNMIEATLTRPFEMQTTTVTQLQWVLVMGENPSFFKEGGMTFEVRDREIRLNPHRPVEQVSWEQVQKYIQRLNRLDSDYVYRLPTNAEWDYAARFGSDATVYSFGDDAAELGDYGWYAENSGGETHDVAGLLPNFAGIYDVHGNVTQWVQDWYGAAQTSQTDPTGPEFGRHRLIRGTGYGFSAEHSRSASSNFEEPAHRLRNLGFRLVRMAR